MASVHVEKPQGGGTLCGLYAALTSPDLDRVTCVRCRSMVMRTKPTVLVACPHCRAELRLTLYQPPTEEG